MTAISLLIASFFFTGLGIFVLRQSSGGYRTPIAATLLCLVIAVLSFVYIGSDFFTGAGIDESILYHFEYGLSGAGFGEYTTLGVTLLVLAVVSLAASIFTYRFLRSEPKNNSKVAGYAGGFLMLFALGIHPAVKDLIEVLGPTAVFEKTEGKFANHYSTPELDPVAKPKNLVFLYLEGLERTYFDDGRFPGLVRGLKSLENEGTSFTDIKQVWGTGWTIAGMTASQCGIPLVTSSLLAGNSMSGMDEFLSGAVCIGDLLAELGYSLSYMGGAKLGFAGKGQFFQTHGFDSVRGFHELQANLSDSSYQSSWGLYDDTLLDLAFQRFDELATGGRPFGLFLLTLDTHHPNGHPSKPCLDMPYGNGNNKILNAVYCSDKLVTEFVRRIRSSEHSANTVVVITSDHLAMRNTATNQLGKSPRRNLLITLTPEGAGPGSVDKTGSTLDVGPTVLSTMGFEVGALGLGRNLLQSDASLVETYSNANEILSAWSDDIALLWNYPTLDFGLMVDGTRQELRFGDRVLKAPTLILLNEEIIIEEVSFPFNSPVKLIDQVASLEPGQPIIWVDRCDHVSTMSVTVWIRTKKLCVATGRLGADNIGVSAVEDVVFLKKREIADFVRNARPNANNSELIIQKLGSVVKYGNPEVSEIAVSIHQNQAGDLFVRSAGFGQGPSYVKSSSKGKIQVKFVRGLTLVGISDDSEATKLAHVDLCRPTEPVKDATTLQGSFADVMSQQGSAFGAYLIVAHDSARCDLSFNMKQLFEGLPLDKWKQIEFRQPYIGVVTGDGEVYEAIGARENSFTLHLTNFIPNDKVDEHPDESLPLWRIAHAGGGHNGKIYTNSLEALNHNKDSYELFEIDLIWTSDDQLVCLHDWEANFKNIFGKEASSQPTLVEFQELAASHTEFENCTADSLVDWLGKNNTKRIVTDVKERNVEALRLISSKFPEHLHRFVPQIYQPGEYIAIKEMGYRDVIWTLYRYPGSDIRVLDELKQMNLYAVTMPAKRATGGLAMKLDEIGVRSYVHTINDAAEVEQYYELGIDEIYTDWLVEDTIRDEPEAVSSPSAG